MGDALRQRSEQGGLAPCAEGAAGQPPADGCCQAEEGGEAASAASSSSSTAAGASAGGGWAADGMPPAADAQGGRSSSSSTGGGAPLPAAYAQALHRSSHTVLDGPTSVGGGRVGSSTGGGAVPLPEQETLMLPLGCGDAAATPHCRVHAAAAAALAAGESPPTAEEKAVAAAAAQLRRQGCCVRGSSDGGSADDASEGGSCADYRRAARDALASPDDSGPHAAAPGGALDPCTCPPFAVKATCGKRPIMEDTYALCPNICELPMPPMSADFADKLPQRIAAQLANGEPSGDAAAAADHAAGEAADESSSAAPAADAAASAPFGGAIDGVAALEKLHFFGVYDGHGGIQASQHCAARLHHHLSASLREMAAGFRGAPAPGGGEAAAGPHEPPDGGTWVLPAVPEVQFVSVCRAVPCDSAAAAAGAAAEPPAAGGGAAPEVRCAPDVSPEDEDALRTLSRDSSNADREKDAAAAVAVAAIKREGAAEAGAAAAAAAARSGDASGGDEACSADGSECTSTSVCALLEDALREAFLKTDEEFSADGTAGLVGSTAVCALVGTHRVWIANCGDSRAVLCRGGQAVQVTDDHKPEREDEAVSASCCVFWGGERWVVCGLMVQWGAVAAAPVGAAVRSRSLCDVSSSTSFTPPRPRRRSAWRRRAARSCTGTATA